MAFCDLHTHSVFSDGTYTPTQLVNSAIALGLDAIALTDHNTADGLPEFLAAAKGKNITAVAGAEFSVDYNGKELHLLGLFLPESCFDRVTALMNIVIQRKDKSNFDLICALNKAGYAIDYDAIKASTPNGKFSRAHIAAELTRKGYTPTIKDAFKTLLRPDAGYYKEPERPSFWQMLDFILELGAVPVLAHPFLNLNKEELVQLLPLAKVQGLAGMECFYPLYDEAATALSLTLAEKHGLLPSGGSDFHGDNKPDIRLGSGKGNLQIPTKWFSELQKTAR